MASPAQACWIETRGRAALRIETLPAPGPHEVCVRALYSGIAGGGAGVRASRPLSRRALALALALALARLRLLRFRACECECGCG
jgi:hypothetical protein